jgi:hypothetical protein
VEQKKIHGQSTDTNNCNSTVKVPDPDTGQPVDLLPPSTAAIPVTIATDAFPHPHQGDPIQLTNTKVTLAVPASLLQDGVTAGLITDGLQVPSAVDVVIKGSNTSQGTKSFHVTQNAVVHVINGQAQPLTATLNLPASTWNPLNDQDPVIFTEQSVKIVSTLDIGIAVATATFNCAPTKVPAFVALAGQGSALPTTTTLPGGNVGGQGNPITVSNTSPHPGDNVNIQSNGWQAGSTVTIILHSDPVTLGTATADATGAINTNVMIPANTSTGSHAIELTGLDPNGQPRSVSIGITVTAAGSSTLPRTGGSVVFWLAIGAILLELGLALMGLSHRRLLRHRMYTR